MLIEHIRNVVEQFDLFPFCAWPLASREPPMPSLPMVREADEDGAFEVRSKERSAVLTPISLPPDYL
jgi:hypothetical protein